MEDLRHVQCHQVFWKFAKVLTYKVERAILTIFQDDVEILGGLNEALVFNDIGVIEVLEQVDFRL